MEQRRRQKRRMSQHGTRTLKNIWFNKGLNASSIDLRHLTLEECGSAWSEVARKQCMQCCRGTDQLLKMFSQPLCVLLSVGLLTPSQFLRKRFGSYYPKSLVAR